MTSKAATPAEYLNSLPEDRKAVITDLHYAIVDNLPKGFASTMGYGMLCYVVPHSLYPTGYHCDPKMPLPFISLASQKNYISFYHMALYEGPLLTWFLEAYAKVSTKKPDMGKCCVRFKKAADVPVALLGELCTKITPEQWMATCEKHLKPSR